MAGFAPAPFLSIEKLGWGRPGIAPKRHPTSRDVTPVSRQTAGQNPVCPRDRPKDNGFAVAGRGYERPMKLRTKLAIGLVGLTLVLSLATYGGLEFYKEQQVDQVQADVDETARLAAGQVGTDIASYRTDLAFVASQVNGSNLSSAHAVVGPYLSQTRFFAAYVVADNGTIVHALGPFNESERAALVGTPAEIHCVNRTLATGDACVSELRAPPGSDPYFVMSAPVFARGEVTGAVAAPIYVDEEAFFTSLATLNTDEQSVRVRYEDETLYRAGQDFTTDVVATATVPGHDLAVVVERDRSTLTDELRTLAFAQALGILLVAGAVVALGYWEYSVNLSQTERLLSGFRAIEAGEYDYDLDVGASEEWDQIRDGFISLASGLAAREEALREREQRLGVLNRVMRHNVRNEMNVVLSYTDMLAEDLDDPHSGMAETASEAGRRLTSLAAQARRVERTLSGEKGDPQPVNLADTVRAVGGEVAGEYPEVSFQGDLPEAQWVRGVQGLREAVRELLTNACKHNDAADPWLEVSLSESPVDETGVADEPTVHLRVSDNGPGIPEHERGAIEKGKETDLDHSSGLGLWLVYWLVDRCDGTLEFEERAGGGAVVDCAFYPADPPATDETAEG